MMSYGVSRAIQCSCMPLISVSWTLFKSPGPRYKFHLDYKLGKGDRLFKFIGNLRYPWMEDLSKEFWVVNSSLNVNFSENKTDEITAGTYMLSTTEIVNSF